MSKKKREKNLPRETRELSHAVRLTLIDIGLHEHFVLGAENQTKWYHTKHLLWTYCFSGFYPFLATTVQNYPARCSEWAASGGGITRHSEFENVFKKRQSHRFSGALSDWEEWEIISENKGCFLSCEKLDFVESSSASSVGRWLGGGKLWGTISDFLYLPHSLLEQVCSCLRQCCQVLC